MDIPMRDGDVQEDDEEEELADETSTPGSSTLEVEKPISDVEDYMTENHNDGTGHDDNSMAASSSSRMASTNCPISLSSTARSISYSSSRKNICGV